MPGRLNAATIVEWARLVSHHLLSVFFCRAIFIHRVDPRFSPHETDEATKKYVGPKDRQKHAITG